jgi:hypothetical protein
MTVACRWDFGVGSVALDRDRALDPLFRSAKSVWTLSVGQLCVWPSIWPKNVRPARTRSSAGRRQIWSFGVGDQSAGTQWSASVTNQRRAP